MDTLYPVIGGEFDGEKWPHYQRDGYNFSFGDYRFDGDHWRFEPLSEEVASPDRYSEIFGDSA